MIKDVATARDLNHFQQLLDKTYIPVWTRDRKIHGGDMPKRLRLRSCKGLKTLRTVQKLQMRRFRRSSEVE